MTRFLPLTQASKTHIKNLIISNLILKTYLFNFFDTPPSLLTQKSSYPLFTARAESRRIPQMRDLQAR